ncbi:MAG TPA: NAD(P)-binding domain-containing protein [Thermoanaerobaculia bacterium]|nr:NAD(P)-binding domain-containing protein [Thermoanaerobaculia bacterium]
MKSHEVAIVGAGPIGLELAVALERAAVDYVQFDAAQIGSTIAWYPIDMMFHSRADRLAIAGVPIQVPDQQKPKREEYLAYLRAVAQQFELRIQSYERVESIERRAAGGFDLTTRSAAGEQRYQARFVVLAIGAMHAPRALGIAGEDAPHVSHYFRDPHDYFGRRLLIVGGRNSAVEAAVRCQRAGAAVTLSYRRSDFDAQKVKWWLLPEIRGMIADSRIRFLPDTLPREIRGTSVLLEKTTDGSMIELAADAVLVLTGYRQETTLFEQLGVALEGEARNPACDPETMETNVPGVFVAGTAVAGTPLSKVSVIVETCHVHVPRIVAAITGAAVGPVAPGREDD